MKKNSDSGDSLLRQKAEKLLRTSAPNHKPGKSQSDKPDTDQPNHHSESEVLKLIHELEVHQVELELMNEELTIAKGNDAKFAAENYTELYEFAPSGFFTLSEDGTIIDLNLTGSQMLGKERKYLKNWLKQRTCW